MLIIGHLHSLVRHDHHALPAVAGEMAMQIVRSESEIHMITSIVFGATGL